MSKILVVYFSVSGQTKEIAQKIATLLDASIHEIIPEKPYTKKDLDWMNDQSRSSIEMSHKSFRPQIANKVVNMEEYDTIYIGFPIWWYVAPTIINTFLESYDLKGKIIIPFATSAGSEMGDTNKELEKSCVGAVLKEGEVFSVNVSDDELRQWIKKIKIGG